VIQGRRRALRPRRAPARRVAVGARAVPRRPGRHLGAVDCSGDNADAARVRRGAALGSGEVSGTKGVKLTPIGFGWWGFWRFQWPVFPMERAFGSPGSNSKDAPEPAVRPVAECSPRSFSVGRRSPAARPPAPAAPAELRASQPLLAGNSASLSSRHGMRRYFWMVRRLSGRGSSGNSPGHKVHDTSAT